MTSSDLRERDRDLLTIAAGQMEYLKERGHYWADEADSEDSKIAPRQVIDAIERARAALLGETGEPESKGTAACVAYDHWASEVRRLTTAIGEVSCPRELPILDENGEPEAQGAPSCFQAAKEDRANWVLRGHHAENEPQPPTLATLARIVADCPECSSLCALIAERKHARKQFGVAKRRVRHVGRTTKGDSTP